MSFFEFWLLVQMLKTLATERDIRQLLQKTGTHFKQIYLFIFLKTTDILKNSKCPGKV